METTFLIVDDDISIRKMLGLLIKKNNLGKVICEIDSGKDAVQEILFYNPDIVLIDLLLPIVDGIEIMKASKKQGYKGKFIMISQVEDESVVSKAYENGIIFFISKPINSIEVINVIKGICHNIELEHSLALIKSAVLNLNSDKNVTRELFIDDGITNIFADIGIAGAVGSNELIKIIHKIIDFKKRNPNSTYKLQKIYYEIIQEEHVDGDVNANKRALEQRVRRTIQKALETISELGCDDYSSSVFMEYSTLLFDFKQVRQEMRHINNALEEPGKINTKKFIESIITKLGS
ncbi:response regulator [Clostridium tagluense]|uniref:response regulator n=1 Tax=Clostridium tagluense TaxID=360422 RepID=UPI001C0B8F1D|nr:response regulator [Clostridium tagluense]MBU3127540.1 response regulator [Clostridium tagluense]MCB2314031.1 response regulator [Clostridium tagluense]MCB2318883.1 response regulator [Clostridium tagluense]MCB2323778.1 response regulator [Clostridium tagluense]MCB2328589.1 response regulator [Clostridium tagluense]